MKKQIFQTVSNTYIKKALTPVLFHISLVSRSNIHDAATYGFSDDSTPELEKLRTHLWDKDWIVPSEMGCSILDLTFFGVLGVNLRPDNICLIRNEYVLAYDRILSDIQSVTTERPRSATVVTGQPGIGASSLECMAPADLAQ